jgi:hypothetical protein
VANPPEGQSCATCRYQWDSADLITGEGKVSYCRRFPPINTETQNIYDHPTLPQTINWCGEYAPANPETVTDGMAVVARLVVLGDLTAARALNDMLKETS